VLSNNLHPKNTDAIFTFNDNQNRTRCEIWTRVMGYHRPIAAWNKGKQAEHRERCYFKEPSGV